MKLVAADCELNDQGNIYPYPRLRPALAVYGHTREAHNPDYSETPHVLANLTHCNHGPLCTFPNIKGSDHQIASKHVFPACSPTQLARCSVSYVILYQAEMFMETM